MSAAAPSSLEKSTIVRSLTAALPGPSGWAASALFVQTPRRMRPTAVEAPMLARSRAFDIRAGGRSVHVHSWGRGAPILLVHGWGGAASQMVGFVAPLVARGRRVIAFDLPGHGRSSGHSTNLVEVAEIVSELGLFAGPLQGVVAHSLGAAAVGVAVHDGLEVARLAVIASAVDPEQYFRRFVATLGLAPAAARVAEDRLVRRVGRTFGDISMLASLSARSLPILVVHDRLDRAAPFVDATRLANSLPAAELHSTRGLGHTRSLADKGVIERVSSFLEQSPISLVTPCSTPGCPHPIDEDTDPRHPFCLSCLVDQDLLGP